MRKPNKETNGKGFSKKESVNFLTEASESKDVHVKDYLKTKIKSVEMPDFWGKDCLKVFISHSVKNYNIAKKLKDELAQSSISCFLAHKDIKPTRKPIEEMRKALNSMKLMVTLITEHFNESYWTHQEVGVALGRNIPIIPIKLDQNDPKGFISEIQAINLTETDIAPYSQNFLNLLNLIKEKFPKHSYHLKNFFKARSISCDYAKIAFMDIIKLNFNDQEIEKIVKEITDTSRKYHGNFGGTNQLPILLYDRISIKHLEQLPEEEKDKYQYYAELLNDKILSQHTQKRYSITEPNGRTHCEIIDNQAIPSKSHKETKEQEFEDIPF
ncbi:MAG: toll/interleukin-1 receptor domain-containing protein [Oligoflexia bacterium]|nr:toll/interleukin-1 receptor domain-containing protein [Oligoflexia bacterium]